MLKLNMMQRNCALILFFLVLGSSLFSLKAQKSNAPQTILHYLSGKGADDAVLWDFCVSDGMNADKWNKIAVPSSWETQGFGKFQYGITFYGKPFPEGIADEVGSTNMNLKYLNPIEIKM